MDFRQLLPAAAPAVDVDELLDSLDLQAAASADRPFLAVNFVASVDGRATVGGRSGGLGDDGDRAMFHGIRERFDAVMAGTGTLAAERYGRILGKAERRERRRRRGLSDEPLAVLFTRSGRLPPEIPLLAEPEARVAIYAPESFAPPPAAAQLTVVRLPPDRLTLTEVVRRLRADFGVASLLCEGGPTLFGGLLRARLVDELFLTVAPKLAGGGEGPTITRGEEAQPPHELEFAWLLERRGSLYHRYRLRQ